MKLFSRPFVPAFAWFIVTVILLTLPGNQFPKDDMFQLVQLDKIVHFVFFFLIVYLFTKPLKNEELSIIKKKKWFLSITLFSVSYGLIIEFIQRYFIVFRSFDMWDIVADAAGCLAAYLYSRKYFMSSKTTGKK